MKNQISINDLKNLTLELSTQQQEKIIGGNLFPLPIIFESMIETISDGATATVQTVEVEADWQY